MAIKRALTVQNIFDKVYHLFKFLGDWFDAFGQPETTGAWFVWGNSGNGKTSFIIQMIKELCQFEKVLFVSKEEGSRYTLKKSLENFGMLSVNKNLSITTDNYLELIERLEKKKSQKIVIIDSVQKMQLNHKQFSNLVELFPNKLLIFISQAEGKIPKGRSANGMMYDSDLKIWVEGYRAFSKGRYFGEKPFYTIWEKGAQKYWE